ncbi:MAG: 16S rRNA (uracil(1498)-N(3))-methyltransferase [Calditrichaeota bacterium]|nr:MAG: 16S rRNA (uracil(1498)-N(3))-methyltransferase [Calditrichota bacterium]MBL1204386.1 16S rRNA (uracil(1498)-N(3))-methyltransferase [Calditrichota bacterium]NOG44215.1 16S rRNA (uracil(1498)-N(3))-methyltransferase [Calditrichota bacterium]
MELFYAFPENISDNLLTLDSFEAKHLTKTLRKKTGDEIDITDGEGNHFSGIIESLKPGLTVKISSKKKIKKDEQNLSLGIAFIRPNRLEFVLEKGTELGVGSFHIFRSEHANYFSDNEKRFEKILRQAIKQSNRFWLPKLYLHKDFKSFIEKTNNIPLKLAAIDPNSPGISSHFPINYTEETLLSIGPEGGFSDKEIIVLKENGFKDVSLGKFRLRAETAAIAGVAKLIL